MKVSVLATGLIGGAVFLGGCGEIYDSMSNSGGRPSSGSGGAATYADVDRAMADLVTLLRESNDVLASIRDEASARQAAQRMASIQERKTALQARINDLRANAKVTRSQGRQLEQKYASQMQQQVQRALREAARINAMPALRAAFDSEARKLEPDNPSAAPAPAGPRPLVWREFRCLEGGFACEFPGNPTRMQTAVPVYDVEVNDVAYTASYWEASPNMSAKDQLRQLADDFASDLKDVQIVDLTFDGAHPAKSIQGIDSDGDLQIGRMFIAFGRLYQVAVVASPDKKDAPETIRFFDSFRLLDVIAEALADLRSTERDRRRTAAERLVNYVATEEDRVEVSAALVPLLSDPDDRTKRSALKALAVWQTPEAVPAIIACLQGTTDHWVRSEAIDLLAKVQDERAAEAVAACFTSDRFRASAALKAMGPIAQKPVAKYLSDPNAAVRIDAIDVLKEVGYAQVVPQVLETLTDPDDGVRHRTLGLLDGCSNPQCVSPVAERLLVDRDRGRAGDCLVSMGPMVEDIVLQGLKHPNPDVFRECCKVLERVGTEKSLPELKRFARHRDGSIRGAAISAGRAIIARGAAP